jgi:hypothetical protein
VLGADIRLNRLTIARPVRTTARPDATRRAADVTRRAADVTRRAADVTRRAADVTRRAFWLPLTTSIGPLLRRTAAAETGRGFSIAA